jgi:ATP-dependent Clp protease ATP-binding subunit ClpC
MRFLSWHYTDGLKFYADRYVYFLRAIVHYFSLPVLIPTLFSPWKRLVANEDKPGFDLMYAFQTASFNLISRGIGAVVRMILFVSGTLTLMLFFVFGAFGFILWMAVPFLSLGVYTKFRRRPDFMAKSIYSRMHGKYPLEVFFKSEPGEFIAMHLGVPAGKLIGKSNPTSLKATLGAQSPNSVSGIVEMFIKGEVWDSMFLREENISEKDILLAANWWDKKQEMNSLADMPVGFNFAGVGRNLLYGYTPKLRQYSSDMGARTDFTHHLIGRGAVVSRIERTLTGGKSVILTGKPGVGKKTVVYEFARRAVVGEFGKDLAYRRVLELDYNFVFSKSADKNRKKQQLADILEEASYAGNIILVLRDLHRMTSEEAESMDLTDILETHLERGKLKIIAISTEDDYEKYLARNARLRKFFEEVEVVEPDQQEAYQIILEAAEEWESKKHFTITIPALNKIMEGSEQYITDTPFPEKALELLDAVVFLNDQEATDEIIDVADVNKVLSEKTGISFANLNRDETKRLTNLEEIIHERLINQERAVNLIAKILRSKSLGIVTSKRPLGSFLFLGPTGVGKTETAKVLAKVYFGSTDKIIRLDMAEYVGREGLERLIGSQDKNQPGALTTAIKNKPASLLLLDEIEKAPPEIFNLFLAMLDEGAITDAFGKRVSCSNLFVIATSNAGAEKIRELVSQGEVDLQEKVTDYILKNNIFSPEFINRFDGVVVYEPLTREHLTKIARIQLSELANSLAKKNINLSFSEDAANKLAEDGYEPEFGARPMRRIIELSIGDLIGKALLSGEVKPGDSIAILPADGKGEFKWEKIHT